MKCTITAALLTAVAILASVGLAALLRMPAAMNVDEWEHGFKTDNVVATRYKNPMFGYTIGFVFPKNPYDADRAELFEWFGKYDGWVFEGGGAPGAALYVKFKDVNDKESANRKLREIMPQLSKFARETLR